MNPFVRALAVVTGYEFLEALRSRRALMVLILYVAMGVLTTNSSINVLQKVEEELSGALQLDAPAVAGSVSASIWKSDRFRRMVARAVGEDSLVNDLIGTPPIVLIYGGLAFFYTPLLVVLIASTRVSEELGSGSARYPLQRTSRLAWSLGKWLGQSVLVGLALLAGGLGAWLVATVRMAATEGVAVIVGMTLTAMRTWVYSLVYVGLATAVSHCLRSAGRATAVAMLGALALSVLSWMCDRWAGPGGRELWHLVRWLTPQHQRLNLWRLDPAYWMVAVVHLVALSLAYFSAGYAMFRRRDL
ncbi:MAG: ABC transporter permease subunit [Kiritimatiellae bacterium]|nr:ABC transporter permease subunit [Kiritimatiellia bacterium]